MYRNLKAEIARSGLSRTAVAEALGISLSTLSCKLAGKSPWLFEEAIKLKQVLGTDILLETLFAS